MDVGSAGSRISPGRTGGFTLVELLVVIVIIAILAAIAFPVFVKAKEYARISQCLSNLREIGGGVQLYLNDYDGCFPAAAPWGTRSYWRETGDQKTIQDLMPRYVHSAIVAEPDGRIAKAGVFACPSDSGMPADIETPFNIPPDKPIWKYTGCSYEYYASNQRDVLNGSDYAEVPPLVEWTGLSPEVRHGARIERVGAPMSAIMRPTKKAVLGDIWFWHMGDEVPIERIRFRDTLFADGHAKRVRGTDHLEARLQQLKPGWHTFDEVEIEVGRVQVY